MEPIQAKQSQQIVRPTFEVFLFPAPNSTEIRTLSITERQSNRTSRWKTMPKFSGRAVNRFATNVHDAGRHRFETADAFEHGTFAAPARADNAQKLA